VSEGFVGHRRSLNLGMPKAANTHFTFQPLNTFHGWNAIIVISYIESQIYYKAEIV